jgi:hypothetical protein
MKFLFLFKFFGGGGGKKQRYQTPPFEKEKRNVKMWIARDIKTRNPEKEEPQKPSLGDEG